MRHNLQEQLAWLRRDSPAVVRLGESDRASLRDVADVWALRTSMPRLLSAHVGAKTPISTTIATPARAGRPVLAPATRLNENAGAAITYIAEPAAAPRRETIVLKSPVADKVLCHESDTEAYDVGGCVDLSEGPAKIEIKQRSTPPAKRVASSPQKPDTAKRRLVEPRHDDELRTDPDLDRQFLDLVERDERGASACKSEPVEVEAADEQVRHVKETSPSDVPPAAQPVSIDRSPYFGQSIPESRPTTARTPESIRRVDVVPLSDPPAPPNVLTRLTPPESITLREPAVSAPLAIRMPTLKRKAGTSDAGMSRTNVSRSSAPGSVVSRGAQSTTVDAQDGAGKDARQAEIDRLTQQITELGNSCYILVRDGNMGPEFHELECRRKDLEEQRRLLQLDPRCVEVQLSEVEHQIVGYVLAKAAIPQELMAKVTALHDQLERLKQSRDDAPPSSGPQVEQPTPQPPALQRVQTAPAIARQESDVIDIASDDDEDCARNMYDAPAGAVPDYSPADFDYDPLDHAEVADYADEAHFTEAERQAQTRLFEEHNRRKLEEQASEDAVRQYIANPTPNKQHATQSTPGRTRNTPNAQLSPNMRKYGPGSQANRVPQTQSVDLMSLPEMQHPWSKEVHRALTETFCLTGFRPNQLEAINTTLSGRDCFVLMPTGGGKSLCYMLPSIVNGGRTHGLTVVVSPLVSLMQDQVEHLRAIGISTSAYNKETPAAEKKDVMRNMWLSPDDPDALKCLYVTPEFLAVSEGMVQNFQRLREQGRLARIVIDEAHCVSQWGHDFRPDYKKLGDFRAQFDGIPVMALTATANERVQTDVKANLRLRNPAVYKQSFNRPNLDYIINTRGKGAMDEVRKLVFGRHKGQCGIVYCHSRQNCEDMAAQLGREAIFYHAGMAKNDRAEAQRAWQYGSRKIVCATIAFGMGIDKPDVRYVIHYALPKSLEGYYQETGRAGRDGNPSTCYLFYQYGDKQKHDKLIDSKSEAEGGGTYEQKMSQKLGVQRMLDYAENKADCRRAQVLHFFNEQFDPKDCGQTCDNCRHNLQFKEIDVTEIAKTALKIVGDLVDGGARDRATLKDCSLILNGSKSLRVLENGWDRLEGHGAAKSAGGWDISNIDRLFRLLSAEHGISENHVANAMGFTSSYVKKGPKYKELVRGTRPLKMRVVAGKGKQKKVDAPSRSNSNTVRDDDEIEDDDDDDDACVEISPANLSRHFSYQSQGSAPAQRAPRKSTTTSTRITRDAADMAAFGRTFTATESASINRCLGELKGARDAVMQQNKLQRYETCFDDAQLHEFAVRLPANGYEMKQVPGVRADAVDRYAFALQQVINKHRVDRLGVHDPSVVGPNALCVPNTQTASATAARPRTRVAATSQGRAGGSAVRQTAPKPRRSTTGVRKNYAEPLFHQDGDEADGDFVPPQPQQHNAASSRGSSSRAKPPARSLTTLSVARPRQF